MLRRLQERPRLLEIAYITSERLLSLFRRWLLPGGWVERAFIQGERISKIPLFDCKMCGQCVLHSTGMTCPMTCPKNLRNGPCGGVRPDGHCEIVPELPCVWVLAWERSKQMSGSGMQMHTLLPPLDRKLEGTSAWINHFTGKARRRPVGWRD
jgi:hypothetical protein